MGGAEGSNLRQVGDADDLTFAGSHLTHHLCHLFGNLSTHASVDLVEDNCGQLDSTANHDLQCEHDTCNLTTRSHLGDGLERGRGVGTEQEQHLVLTASRE